jgi:hypothetical protein
MPNQGNDLPAKWINQPFRIKKGPHDEGLLINQGVP